MSIISSTYAYISQALSTRAHRAWEAWQTPGLSHGRGETNMTPGRESSQHENIFTTHTTPTPCGHTHTLPHLHTRYLYLAPHTLCHCPALDCSCTYTRLAHTHGLDSSRFHTTPSPRGLDTVPGGHAAHLVPNDDTHSPPRRDAYHHTTHTDACCPTFGSIGHIGRCRHGGDAGAPRLPPPPRTAKPRRNMYTKRFDISVTILCIRLFNILCC